MRLLHNSIFAFISVLVTITLASCSKEPPLTLEVKEPQNFAEEETEKARTLYNEALAFLDERRFQKAIETFQEVETTYPYAKEAGKSLLMGGYAHYKNEQYNDAIVTLMKFISLYPSHEMTSYAYYLKALCSYDQIVDVGRDQQITKDAKKSLQEVVARFPNSEYAQDASIKLDLVEDHLAGKQMEVGYFYQKRGNHISAINRFQDVVRHYQTTSHVAEALYRLAASYYALGVEEEAVNYAAVLAHNYPKSKWYRHSYQMLRRSDKLEQIKEPGWVERLWRF